MRKNQALELGRAKRTMNRLPIEERAKIIQMLVEGASLRATARFTKHSPQTVTKLIRDVGDACLEWHHRKVRKTLSRKVQVDEIGSTATRRTRH